MKWDPFLSRLEWDYIQFLLTIPIVRTIPKPQSLLRSEGFGSTLLLRFRKGLCYTCSCDTYHPHWDLSIPPGGYFFLLKLLRFSKNIGVLQKLATHYFCGLYEWVVFSLDMPSRWFSFPLDSSRDMGNPMGNVFDFFISTKSENMQNANPVLRDLHSGPKFCSTRWMDVVDGMGYFFPHNTTYQSYQTILYPFVSPCYMLGNCSIL